MELIVSEEEKQAGQEGKKGKRITLTALKKRLIGLCVAAAFLLLLLGGAWITGRRQMDRKYEEIVNDLKRKIDEQNDQIDKLRETPVVVNPVAPEILLDVVSSEIKEIGELATVQYLFTDAAKFSDSKQIKNWNIPFTEKSFILKWNGAIKAGVEVDKIAVELEENESERKLIVSVPAAKILSYEIDMETVEKLDEKNNIFNRISIDDKIQFDAATEKAMKERAVENGVLEQAQRNAEDIITKLLLTNPDIAGNCTIEFKVIDDN